MHSRQPLLALLLATGLLLLSPCQAMQLDESLEDDVIVSATEPPPALESVQSEAEPERAAIAGYLRANLGEPYRYGATGGSEGFDCSGLVLRAYEAAGRTVPRVSDDLLHSGSNVPLTALRAGDLLFYRMRSNQPQRLHVVVYVGNGRAIHASVTHKEVREIDVTRKVWREKLVAARTLL